MNHDTLYRLWELRDLKPLSTLFDGYRQFYKCPPDVTAARNWLEVNYRESRSSVWVAEENDQIVGFTQLYPAHCSVELVSYFVLYDLYVAESARRRGIARGLMNAASAWAKAQGAARIDLETARDNQQAQGLYRDLGYQLDAVFLKFSLDLGNRPTDST